MFSVQYSVCSVQCSGFRLVFSVQCSVFSAQCSLFIVHYSGFRFECSVFSVQCLGFSVQCLEFSVEFRPKSSEALKSFPLRSDGTAGLLLLLQYSQA